MNKIFSTRRIQICILFLLFFLVSVKGYSQTGADTIFKKNKEVLLVKIQEIGIEEVKYKPLLNPNDITLVIEISQIEKIVFFNGTVQKFDDLLNSKASYVGQHANVIKLAFFGPLGHRFSFNFEHSIKPGLSYEAGIGILGPGEKNKEGVPRGVMLNGGIRFYRVPDMKSRSDRYSHLLHGAYLQPGISFGTVKNTFSQNIFDPFGTSTATTTTQSQSFLMVMLNLGKQSVFRNKFSIDFSVGMGYGTYTYQNRQPKLLDGDTIDGTEVSNGYQNNKWRTTRYGFLIGGPGFPICLNSQLKLGLLF